MEDDIGIRELIIRLERVEEQQSDALERLVYELMKRVDSIENKLVDIDVELGRRRK